LRLKYVLHMSESYFVAAGFCQIKSKTDEDRFNVSIMDTTEGAPSIFSVFDGHGGEDCSTLCQRNLNRNILEYYRELLVENGLDHKDFADWQLKERYFCEAVREVVEKMDGDTKDGNTSGSTMVSIFCWQLPDGATRVICPWVGDSRCVMYHRNSHGDVESLEMSEDHKPSLEREVHRIKEDLEVTWPGKPLDISRSQNYTTVLLSEGISQEVSHKEEKKDSEMMDAKMFHKQSFMAIRTHPDHPNYKGPLAIFSRQNVSITMTRSIGDRYGPRCCVATPDISAVTIPHDQHARFVLASDGLWDVITIQKTQDTVFSILEASKVAKKLADKALEKRVRQEIKIDDITVIVVDIHPKHLQTHSKGCKTS